MALKRIMGTETEYGISGGNAGDVVRAHNGKKTKHNNFGETNESVVEGMTDIGGHIGGDYGVTGEQREFNLAGPRTFYGSEYRTAAPKKTKYAKTPKVRGYTYDTPDGVLENGARFYVDMGHPEYSTPEVSNARDLVIVDKAGEWIVDAAAKKAGKNIRIYKNNSDSQGNSYGCHENYTIKRFNSGDFDKIVAKGLLPFFITRQVFTGSGKIGIEAPEHFSRSFGYSWDRFEREESRQSSYELQRNETLNEIEKLGKHFLDMPDFKQVQELLQEFTKKRENAGEQQIYQLSQRGDFFETVMGLQTTSNRPIINTRDEPHADKNKYMRLHVICGDANMSEVADFLKIGTTGLVLDLIEDGISPNIEIKRPVKQIQDISLDQTRKWIVGLTDGKTIPAVDIQRFYLRAALDNYKGRDRITDDILQRWEDTLNHLETDPMKLAGSVDWVIKLNLLSHLMQKHGCGLNDSMIKNAALQYHDTDKTKSLFYFLQNNGLVERLVSDDEISHAINNPPEDTRAYLRGKIGKIKGVSSIDWGGFKIKTGKKTKIVDLNELFCGTKQQVGHLFDGKVEPEKLVEILAKQEGIEVTDQGFFSKCYDKVTGVSLNTLTGFVEDPTEIIIQ